MKELEKAINIADLDSITLGRVIAKIVLEQYGQHNSSLFLRGFNETIKS